MKTAAVPSQTMRIGANVITNHVKCTRNVNAALQSALDSPKINHTKCKTEGFVLLDVCFGLNLNSDTPEQVSVMRRIGTRQGC